MLRSSFVSGASSLIAATYNKSICYSIPYTIYSYKQ